MAAKGLDAPDFVLTDLQGHNVKLSDLRGKAVVLNFWATWCPPCKAGDPLVCRTAEALWRDRDCRSSASPWTTMATRRTWQKFAAENSINYPVLLGQDKVAEQYGGIDYLPTTFYIDRNGVVIDRVFGQPERDEIEQNVKRAIASTAKPRS